MQSNPYHSLDADSDATIATTSAMNKVRSAEYAVSKSGSVSNANVEDAIEMSRLISSNSDF